MLPICCPFCGHISCRCNRKQMSTKRGRSGWASHPKAKARKRRRAYGRRFRRPTGGRRFRPGYDRTGGFYGYGRRTPEIKFHDVDIDDASIAQNGTILTSACLIAQGATESTRIGRKCTIVGINWRYNLKLSSVAGANAQSSEQIRLVMYQDKQCNGAAATVTDILESDFYQSFNNIANKKRFRILMDKNYTLNSVGGGGDGAVNDWPDFYIEDSFYKKCNIPLEFDNTAGAITELKSNNIGVMILSKTGSVSVLDSKCRLRFLDL